MDPLPPPWFFWYVAVFRNILPSVEILYTGLYTGFLANDEERLYSKAKIMRDNIQREMNSHNSRNSYYLSIEIDVRYPKV